MRDSEEKPTLENVIHEFLDHNDARGVKEMLKDMLLGYFSSDTSEVQTARYNSNILFLYFQLCELVEKLEACRGEIGKDSS